MNTLWNRHAEPAALHVPQSHLTTRRPAQSLRIRGEGLLTPTLAVFFLSLSPEERSY